MAAEKEKIGHVDCEHCKKEVTVRINRATGALSFPCHDCGMPAYAKKDGSDYYRDILASVRKLAGAGRPDPVANPTPAPVPAPAPKPAGLFSF